MRIGIAAARHRDWPKLDWVEQAARRMGHDVLRTTEREATAECLRSCDVVILGQKSLAGRWITLRDAIENRTCPVVYWWFDLVATHPGVPLSGQPLFETYRNLFTASDVVLVKERGLLDEYRECGVNAFWCDQGCPADYPARETLLPVKWDVLLWGQVGHYRHRVRDARLLAKEGLRVAWASRQAVPDGIEPLPWTHLEDLPSLAGRARCVLSVGVRNDIAGYWSDSLWLALGMGACVLRRAVPGLPDGPYLQYHRDEQLMGCARWIMKNADEAEELASRARQWTMHSHTLDNRVEEALGIVRTAETKESCSSKAAPSAASAASDGS